MYLSVTAGIGHGDFLIEAQDPIYSGTAVIPWANTPDHDVGSLLWNYLELAERDWWAELHVLEIDDEGIVDEATPEGTGGRRVLVPKYAWWMKPDVGCCGIVTTRTIFILGTNGKTIHRVR